MVHARLGIADGDRVQVASEVGEVVMRARVTQAIHPEAVFLVHGYGVNDSALLADRTEPFAGSGATGEAALLEGRDSVMVEADATHIPLIEFRRDRATNTKK